MKKKILALFLCCVIVLGLLPTTLAFADETELKVSADTVSLKKSETKDLTADAGTLSGTYQWQIQTGAGVWVNILGANGKTLTLKYGLVASLLQNNTARIRCHMTTDAGKALDSNVVTVEIQPDAAVAKAPAKAPAMFPAIGTVVTQATPIGDPVIVSGDTTVPAAEQSVTDNAPVADSAPSSDSAPSPDSAPLSDSAPATDSDTPQSDDSAQNEVAAPAPTTYVIEIKYQFANGTQAAPSWTATVATGSTYTQDIQSPVVVGYTPNQSVVRVETSEAKTYIVTYQPAEVEFTVKHYQQNVDNDNYTLVDTVTEKGFTESPVGDKLAKSYDGFYSLLYETTTEIAADGSTVVEIKYDRYYYLMNFNLDGGYGVEPIYARFGAAISVDTPTKPGYTFESWTPSIPAVMPDQNTSYTASWKIGESGFTVVFWYENANDDGYSVAGTYKPANVMPGTEKKSGDYKNQNFTGRDTKHFTYNAAKAETVTVKGDGSTVLNVYYTRNAYTLTFKGRKTEITCGKEEHEHTHDGWYYKAFDGTYYYGGCYPAGSYNGLGTGTGGAKSPTCGKAEHTHRNSCYKTSDLTITAKYQADIHGNFPIKDGNDTIWWNVPQGTETYGNSDEQRYLGSIDTMPGENITFTKKGAESGAKIYYYVETLNGEQGDTTYNRRTYKQYKVIDLEYSSRTNLTYAEEFHPITGFSQGDSNPKLPVGGEVRMKETNYLYYTRNSYSLKFYNYNDYVIGKGGNVQYEAPLSGYNFTPDYPAGLEPNAYVFDGWYTTAGCYEGSKANLNTMTMPASDVILYAKWVPKTHTVKTWLTNEMIAVVSVGNTDSNVQTIAHGTTAVKPKDPKNGNYTFVGWFYEDNGVEKAFDFSMPVNRDLNLYAKWSSNTLMNFEVRYKLEDGTEIAQPFTGSALAGSTKTFNAKTGTELNEGYQSGYFPNTSSHSVTIDIANPDNNTFTFVYVPKAEVTYTVKYLEKGTNNQLADPKTVKTRDAVVTETFKQITGYAPDAYQKQLVLSADDEENEIIFWYVKDTIHAPVQVIHWIQNIEGDGYTEYQSSTNLNGVIETEYFETPLTIAGFSYNGTESNASGKLTVAGLVLNLYYDRVEYPYEFRFVEKDSNPEKQLAESVRGTARYQKLVTQKAKDIPGYTLVSTENQAINIAIEDGTTAVKNVKIFYYTEQTVDIKYEVVGPDGCGTLDNYQESQLKVMTGEVKGSTPTANPGFKFVGWFMDETCVTRVEDEIPGAVDSTANKLTPQKRQGENLHFAATYYAQFENDVADLTITKSGWKTIDENQSFIFKVTGGDLPADGIKVVINGDGDVTIAGLKIAEYTVTEVTSWSWRYTPDSEAKEITLSPTDDNKVTFTNRREKIKWLGGDGYKPNIFGNSN